jgi:TonB family protein
MRNWTVRSLIIGLLACHSPDGAQSTQPRKQKHVEPTYPPESLGMGDEGEFIIELHVDKSGGVENARIVYSGCQRLEKSALDAVRQWRYEPLQVNGQPAPFDAVVRVPFRLPQRFATRVGRPGRVRVETGADAETVNSGNQICSCADAMAGDSPAPATAPSPSKGANPQRNSIRNSAQQTRPGVFTRLAELSSLHDHAEVGFPQKRRVPLGTRSLAGDIWF